MTVRVHGAEARVLAEGVIRRTGQTVHGFDGVLVRFGSGEVEIVAPEEVAA